MNALTTPTTVRILFVLGTVVFLVCAAALPYAVVRFRRSLTDSAKLDETPSGTLLSPDSFAFATFQQTIRDLKEREKDLQGTVKREKERADAACALTRSLTDSIPLPALSFNAVGIVQSANIPARALFGRESLVGFSLKNVFGDGLIESRIIDAIEIPAIPVVDLIRDTLRGRKPLSGLKVECKAHAESHVVLELTIVPDRGGAGIVLVTGVSELGKGPCTDEVPSIAETSCSSDT